jgi:tetratricopeptide (TPR) repeat protein
MNMPNVAVAIPNSDPMVQMDIGNHFFSPQAYNLMRAQRQFLRVIELDKKYPGAHYQLGRTYFIVSKFPQAFLEMEAEERVNPSFGKVHYMKGLIAGYAKTFPLAEREFKEFINYDSFNWAGYNDLAWIYFAQGKFKESEDIALQGLKNAYENPWLHNALGVAQLAQQNKAEAKSNFEIAKKGFQKMSAGQWGGSYPGNSPAQHDDGLTATLKAVERNILRTSE